MLWVVVTGGAVVATGFVVEGWIGCVVDGAGFVGCGTGAAAVDVGCGAPWADDRGAGAAVVCGTPDADVGLAPAFVAAEVPAAPAAVVPVPDAGCPPWAGAGADPDGAGLPGAPDVPGDAVWGADALVAAAAG